MTFRIAGQQGRLLICQISSVNTPAETAELAAKMAAHVQAVGAPVVRVIDQTQITQLSSPEHIAAISNNMRRNDEHLLRAAILLGSSGQFGIQMYRIIKEVGKPNRRGFLNAKELRDWLAEILTAEELAALDAYLQAVHADLTRKR